VEVGAAAALVAAAAAAPAVVAAVGVITNGIALREAEARAVP